MRPITSTVFTFILCLTACGDEGFEPREGPTWAEFRQNARVDLGYKVAFIIEGDIVVTEQELRNIYDEKYGSASGVAIGQSASRLVAEQWDGVSVQIQTGSTLRYCFDRLGKFNSSLSTLSQYMKQAGAEWSAHANINFVENTGDFSCETFWSVPEVDFVVTTYDGSDTSVAGFYEPRKVGSTYPAVLVVNVKDFDHSWWLRTIRHELGHALGLGHEHERITQKKEDACAAGTIPYSPLTYITDPSSIMFYPGCEGASSAAGTELSYYDKVGVERLHPGRKKVAFRHPTRKVVISVAGGSLNASTTRIGQNQTFTIRSGPGQKFLIQTHNGYYVREEAGTARMLADSFVPTTAWYWFELVKQPNGQVAIRTPGGDYLGVDSSNQLSGAWSSVGPDSSFLMADMSGIEVHLRPVTSNRVYMIASPFVGGLQEAGSPPDSFRSLELVRLGSQISLRNQMHTHMSPVQGGKHLMLMGSSIGDGELMYEVANADGSSTFRSGFWAPICWLGLGFLTPAFNSWSSLPFCKFWVEPTSTHTPSHWWSMDNQSPGDSGSQARALTLHGGYTYTQQAANGSALKLAQRSYAEMPNAASINFGHGEDFTIGVWVKAETHQPYAIIAHNDIIEKFDYTSRGYPFIIRFANHLAGSRAGQVFVARNDGTHEPTIFSTRKIGDNRFHHVAFVKRGGRLFLYIDGVLDGTTLDTTTGNTRNNSPLYIGRNGSVHANSFTGTVDEVRIYDTGLYPKEVRYLAGLGFW